MGPPDQCQHAASIITDLLQSIRAREEGGQGVSRRRSVSASKRDGANFVMLTGMWLFFYRALQALVCHLEAEVAVEARATGVLQEER